MFSLSHLAVILALIAVSCAKKKIDDGVIRSEVESKKGGIITIDCRPGDNITSIVWKIGEVKKDKEIEFGDRIDEGVSGDLDNGRLVIKNVDFTDRNFYNCHQMKRVNQTHSVPETKSFRLRVRDPLGPLWPVLGIVIGAILLAIVIGSHEYMNKPAKPADASK